MTSDYWTSISNKSFLSLTIHYINKKFEYKHFLLECKEIFDTHTSKHSKDAILEIL